MVCRHRALVHCAQIVSVASIRGDRADEEKNQIYEPLGVDENLRVNSTIMREITQKHLPPGGGLRIRKCSRQSPDYSLDNPSIIRNIAGFRFEGLTVV